MPNMCEGQYFVLGGELEHVDPTCARFKDPTQVHFVGSFDSFEAARDAWKANAQRTVDNAHMRYFILGAEDLLHPQH
jgi:hypothetical protein